LKRELDSGLLIAGMLMGLSIGGVVTLFTAPKNGIFFRLKSARSVNDSGENMRPTIDALVAIDPVAQSMTEGKAAARRRLTELGRS
jgi:gas vesicle protein